MEKKFQVFRNVLEIRNSLRRRVLRRQPIGCCKIASTLNDSGRALRAGDAEGILPLHLLHIQCHSPSGDFKLTARLMKRSH